VQIDGFYSTLTELLFRVGLRQPESFGCATLGGYPSSPLCQVASFIFNDLAGIIPGYADDFKRVSLILVFSVT
jgi:hypothetical protein